MTYESSVKTEREEKEKFRIEWMDAQRQIDQDGDRLHQLLNETSSNMKYSWRKKGAKPMSGCPNGRQSS